MDAIDAIRASLNAYPEDRLDRETARALLDRLGRAEARIRHLEDTAQVLVKEVLDAENARDENRRGKAEAEARIKAVRDVLELHGPAHDEPGQDEADCGHQIITDIRHALEG